MIYPSSSQFIVASMRFDHKYYKGVDIKSSCLRPTIGNQNRKYCHDLESSGAVRKFQVTSKRRQKQTERMLTYLALLPDCVRNLSFFFYGKYSSGMTNRALKSARGEWCQVGSNRVTALPIIHLYNHYHVR